MVLINAEDDFMSNTQIFVVVGTEHLEIVVAALEFVTQIDYLLAVLGALLIVRSTSIDASVQVKLSQNHVDQTLASAILLRVSRQLLCTLFHILNQPLEEVGTIDLLRICTTHLRVLIDERYITKHVDSVQVAQTTQGTSLGTILLHGGIVSVGSLTNLSHHLVAE